MVALEVFLFFTAAYGLGVWVGYELGCRTRSQKEEG